MIGWKPGEKISEPGIYPIVPLDDYHGDICAGHSASHSSLDRIFVKSPRHYWDKCYANKDAEPDSPTAPMQLGRACHHLFLGERQFQKHFIRRPLLAPDGRQWNGLNKTCIEWLEKTAKRKLTVITPDQIERISRMKVSLDSEPLIRSGVLAGKIEQSFFWIDSETRLWMKARPDAVPAHGDFVDLKIMADVTDDGISRAIGQFGYHRQAALVLEGAHHLLGYPLVFRGAEGGEGMSFSLVCVESDRPHCVEFVTLRPADIERGMEENRAARKLLRRCLDADEWPGPSGHQKDARYIGISKAVVDRNDNRLAQINAMLSIAPPELTEIA